MQRRDERTSTGGYPPMEEDNWEGYGGPSPQAPWPEAPQEEEPQWAGYGASEAEKSFTGDAPELRKLRSENISNKKNTFWDGYDPAWQSGKQRIHHRMEERRPPKGHHPLVIIATALGGLLAIAAVMTALLFRIDDVQVIGNNLYTKQQIIDLAGVHVGDNSLLISDQQLQERLESQRYLKLVLVDRTVQHRLTITVRERVPVVRATYNGHTLLLDKRGLVLEDFKIPERTRNEDYTEMERMVLAYPKVIGLNIKRAAVGRTAVLYESDKLDVFTEMVIEMKAMGFFHRVTEVDLLHLDNLYMKMDNGTAVRLGAANRLHEKLRSLILTLQALEQKEAAENVLYHGGTIDVTIPEKPTYRPSQEYQGEEEITEG